MSSNFAKSITKQRSVKLAIMYVIVLFIIFAFISFLCSWRSTVTIYNLAQFFAITRDFVAAGMTQLFGVETVV